MPGLTPDDIFRIVVLGAVFLLVAFPIHEFSHAWMANRLGDSTARYMGRLTLDPVAHFDLMGGGLLILSLIASGGSFAVGMAKPTPVNPSNLRGGRRGEMWVSLAGPVSNLVLAAVGAILIRLIAAIPDLARMRPAAVGQSAVRRAGTFVFIDIVLFVFNLIPVPPLDGWAVLRGLVSPQVAWDMTRVQAQVGLYGILIVFASCSSAGRRSSARWSGGISPLTGCPTDGPAVVVRSWWWQRSRQAVRHVTARVPAAELADLASSLTPAQQTAALPDDAPGGPAPRARRGRGARRGRLRRPGSAAGRACCMTWPRGPGSACGIAWAGASGSGTGQPSAIRWPDCQGSRGLRSPAPARVTVGRAGRGRWLLAPCGRADPGAGGPAGPCVRRRSTPGRGAPPGRRCELTGPPRCR